ncbi:MAG: hypothetical protein Q8942_05845 [Bacillota bacterium]|nr:hypothetical protein [Bacillota bacterium]
MSECCKKYEADLIDIYYGELEMSDEIKTHLEECDLCASYLKGLEEVKSDLSLLDSDINIDNIVDETLIRKAFAAVDKKTEKKNRFFDLAIFLSIAAVIIAAALMLAYKGYGIYLIYFQAAVFFLAPIGLLGVIKMRQFKEGV